MAEPPAGTLGVPSRTARGIGARAAALACGGMLLLAACSGAPQRPAAPPTTSSRPRTPAEICALQVGHWAAEVIKPGYQDYGDYQKMGLIGAYYELMLDIAKQAKQLQRTATREQTLAFIASEAKRRCAEVTTTTCATRRSGYPSCPTAALGGSHTTAQGTGAPVQPRPDQRGRAGSGQLPGSADPPGIPQRAGSA